MWSSKRKDPGPGTLTMIQWAVDFNSVNVFFGHEGQRLQGYRYVQQRLVAPQSLGRKRYGLRYGWIGRCRMVTIDPPLQTDHKSSVTIDPWFR